MENPLFQNVDCVSFHVDDLDEGLKFYRGALGLKLLWRTETACGLGMGFDVTEVVITTERHSMVQFKVASVEESLPYFLRQGGELDYGPFDIDIGECALVHDKWGNSYTLLDMTKGHYATDESGQVTGVEND